MKRFVFILENLSEYASTTTAVIYSDSLESALSELRPQEINRVLSIREEETP